VIKQLSTNAVPNIVLFDGDQRRYFSLDALAALVWKLVQQPITLREMIDAVVDRFGLEPEAAEQDLLDVLAEMETQGLIETANS
jgi:hypothetical protein